MAVEFKTTGKGVIGEIASGWSVQEYATPTNADDTSSSTNSVGFSGATKDTTQLLVDKTGTFKHISDAPEIPALGSIVGPIGSVGISGAMSSASQKSIFTQLNVERQAKAPVPGSLFRPENVLNSGAASFNSRQVLNVTTDLSGDNTYVMYRMPGNNQVWIAKIATLTGAVAWRTPATNTAYPVTEIAVSTGGYVLFQISVDRVGMLAPDGSVGVASQAIFNHGGTAVAAGNMSISEDRENNFFVSFGSNAASSGVSGRNEFTKLKPAYNVANNYYTLGAIWNVNLANGFNTTSPLSWVTAAQILSDDRMLAYGPVLPSAQGGAVTDNWGIYQFTVDPTGNTDPTVSRVLKMTTTVTPNNGVTDIDENGMFLIGDHQFNAVNGTENFAWPQQTAAQVAAYSGAVWRVTNNTNRGFANYFYTNAIDSNSPTNNSIKIVGINTRVSLSDIFNYYFSLVFGKAFAYNISWQASQNPSVVVPGWVGNVWDHICQLCVAYRVEMVIVDNVPIVRDICSTSINIDELGISPSFSPSAQGSARYKTLHYYNPRTVSAQGRQAFNLQNLVTNPSARNNVTGYVVPNSSSSVTRVGGASAYADGRYAMSVSPTADASTNATYAVYGQAISNSGTRYGTNKRMGLQGGVSYVFSIDGRLSVNKQKGVLHQYARCIVVRQWKADGTYKDAVSKPLPNVGNGQWTHLTLTVTMDPAYPDAAVFLFNGSKWYDSYNNSLAWSHFRITAVGQETQDQPDDFYYDGDSPGWGWTGTTGNSTSQRAIAAVPADNLLYDAYKDNNVLSVDVNGLETTTIETNSYPTTIDQPVPTSDLYESRYGYYYVSASDNLPVQASQWIAYGGKVTVAQNPDSPSSIDITLTGPKTKIPGVVGPFRLAASDGQNDYAFFSITGTGVRTDPKTVRLSTGANEQNITQEDAGETDNFAITDIGHAYDVGFEMVSTLGTATSDLSFGIPTARLTKFGLTPGSTFRYKKADYRVISASIHNAMTDIQAVRYTLIDDVAAAYDGMLVEQVAALWDGYSAQDTVLMPYLPVS